jgi:hypothetical protein
MSTSHASWLSFQGLRTDDSLQTNDVLMQSGLSRGIDNAHVHASRVEIDAAVKWMLLLVEPHHAPP